MPGFVVGLTGAAAFIAAVLLVGAGMLYVLVLVVTGLLAASLGRLVSPGPEPAGVAGAFLVGVAGAVLGGGVGWFMFRGWAGFLLSLVGGAFLVWLTRRPGPSPRMGG